MSHYFVGGLVNLVELNQDADTIKADSYCFVSKPLISTGLYSLVLARLVATPAQPAVMVAIFQAHRRSWYVGEEWLDALWPTTCLRLGSRMSHYWNKGGT